MEKFEFFKLLSFKVHKLKGNNPFDLEDIIDDKKLILKYKKDILKLIENDNFFLKFFDKNKNKFIKTYRIPEICQRTINELEKENINPKILKLIKNYPLLLHTEFERWLYTKHKSMLSYILHKYWHNFMIYSYEYNFWCYDNFGYLIHHIPTPDYENLNLTSEDIIIDHIEYFTEYRKKYPISKSILFYNFPYKLFENNIKFRKIKKIIFDLINEIKLPKNDDSNINLEQIKKSYKTVKKDLKKQGFSVIKNLNLDEFYTLNKKLGSIINITNITINKSSNRKFNSYEPMPLHTDAYDVDIVSWFCQEQDKKDGTIILKSLRNYKKFFSKKELKILKTIKVKYPIYKRFYTGEHPLLNKGNFYYSPWLLKDNYSKEQLEILNKFQKYIDKQEEIRILLKTGEILIIDNLSIIHGRDKIEENSNRLLYRTHIMI